MTPIQMVLWQRVFQSWKDSSGIKCPMLFCQTLSFMGTRIKWAYQWFSQTIFTKENELQRCDQWTITRYRWKAQSSPQKMSKLFDTIWIFTQGIIKTKDNFWWMNINLSPNIAHRANKLIRIFCRMQMTYWLVTKSGSARSI